MLIAIAICTHALLTEHTPAVLSDYQLKFSLRGIPYAEPSFANVEPSPGSEVHGVGFCMTKTSMLKLDSIERGYKKQMVDLTAYDGRKLNGFVYIKETDGTEIPPSKRYLGVLCKGARQAGLNKEYIAKLEARLWPLDSWRRQGCPPDWDSQRSTSRDTSAQHSRRSVFPPTWTRIWCPSVVPASSMRWHATRSAERSARSPTSASQPSASLAS